ncbi:DNA/RNA non-specific endonuclease [uncultured Rikenella sp.]|uniref:DNA/RNA non-specific endonuclease n=1 Tax=uncultured Rikenella sp. TaxID=368003 RepID=UPI002616C75E|nr:DNA/RNA non-specific endonuclease [uncultured Rikenella sp.]
MPGGLELPVLGDQDTAIYNEEGRYTFLYRPECKVSRWVAYKLTLSDVTGDAGRSDAFRPDPRLEIYGWASAGAADYKGSGYDRGHLLPSADRKCSEPANRATFLYSNMAPQLPKLNRGVWKTLEEKLRELTRDYDTLYIVAGTVLPGRWRTIGDGVAVPDLFFKAVALRKADDFEGVAYVMPNGAVALEGKRFDDFEVTVDSVERLTGLDLFPQIPGF